MGKFKYVGVTSDGTRVSDVIEASSAAAARNLLSEKDLQIEQVSESVSIFKRSIGKVKVPRHEVMLLSRQLASFIKAGIPILDGIEVIAEESGNSGLRSALFEVSEGLRAGETLSAAFGRHPAIFPKFYIDMLKSAELTGRLDVVLSQLSGYIERDLDAKQKIRSALAYPLIIVGMSLVTVVVMTVFVIPRFQSFFESLGAELPLPTRILIAVTNFLTNYWWAVVGGIALLALLLYLSAKTEGGKSLLDRTILRLPVVGEIVRFAIIERFCRILAAMVQAGVPLPEAMLVVTEGTNNAAFQKGLAQVRTSMLEGEGLSRPISQTKLFPRAVVQMVRVGEDTGTLDEQLETSASFYETELGFKIKKMTTFFEPAVLIGVGLLVGFVAIAVVSAMYGIFRQVGSLR